MQSLITTNPHRIEKFCAERYEIKVASALINDDECCKVQMMRKRLRRKEEREREKRGSDGG